MHFSISSCPFPPKEIWPLPLRTFCDKLCLPFAPFTRIGSGKPPRLSDVKELFVDWPPHEFSTHLGATAQLSLE